MATSPRYVEGLVGFWSYPPPNDAEDAADFYFDSGAAAADRRAPRRADHRRRARATDGLARPEAGRARPPASARPGARWSAGGGRIRRFKPQEKLFELSNRILKCLDAANRPYAEVLRLGLCPKEWLTGDDAVGVNTLKSANAFLKALKEAMRGEFGRRPTREELDAAFAKAPVPGFKTAAEFAATPLGAAAMARLAGLDQTYLVSYDAARTPMRGHAGERGRRAADERRRGRAVPRRGGRRPACSSPPRANCCGRSWPGANSLSAMGDNLALRRRLKHEFGGDLAAYVDELSARTARFVAEAAGRP